MIGITVIGGGTNICADCELGSDQNLAWPLCVHIAGHPEGENSREPGEVCRERCKYLVFVKGATVHTAPHIPVFLCEEVGL